mmetsp:Transcript_1509/g.2110  ORF Transcript_1509/g.2110 Transcript_1509/m.2110 type:complete len:93 (-) Transcript_1509:87-365(-)
MIKLHMKKFTIGGVQLELCKVIQCLSNMLVKYSSNIKSTRVGCGWIIGLLLKFALFAAFKITVKSGDAKKPIVSYLLHQVMDGILTFLLRGQ